ncbi:hypothetical protein ACS3SW_03595 [Roseobacteraceae bacterium S113]
MVNRLEVAWLDVLQDPEHLSPERERARALLAEQGVHLTHYAAKARAMRKADLIILGQTVSVDWLPDDKPVLGLRTLNRRTRLDVLAESGLPVQPYGTPSDDDAFAALIARWNVDFAVVKLDWSFRRAGVTTLPVRAGQKPRLPLGFDPSMDIVMQPVTGDPRTLKVDLFAGHVLGATWLDTRPVATPNWQMIGVREQWPTSLSKSVENMLAQASTELLRYGCGYASIDVMFGEDGPVIIEANTTSIGTSFWRDAPDPYAQNLARAIGSCVRNLDDLPTVKDIAELARTNRNENEAASLEPNPDQLTLPADLDMHMDAMMREADRLSEAERAELGRMVEADLMDHARQTVPAYMAKPGMLGQIIKSSTFTDHPLDFVSRHWPNGHGMLSYDVSPDLDTGQATLRTRFSYHVQAAAHRRALRWLGVKDPGRTVELIDRANAGQMGLGSDTPVKHVIERLDGLGAVSLWTTSTKALALADAIGECAPEHLHICGIVTSSPPLSRADRRKITDATGAPVAEVLSVPPAGTIAIRCPDLGLYHVLADVGRVEVNEAAGRTDHVGPLIVTGFYNFAQPMIRVETGLQGCLVASAPACSCPISNDQKVSLV